METTIPRHQGDQSEILSNIQSTLQNIQSHFQRLFVAVENVEDRLKRIEGPKTLPTTQSIAPTENTASGPPSLERVRDSIAPPEITSCPASSGADHGSIVERRTSTSSPAPNVSSSKIILTTYPGQSGIDPIPMRWGHKDAIQRGPVVVSRAKATVRRRNAIGAHGGSYSIYYALAVASKNLNAEHRPDFTDTQPAVDIGPFPQWSDQKKIVSMDPWGHLSPWKFPDLISKENVDIRPTIAVTKAHMHLPELEDSVRSGRLIPDGKICLNDKGDLAVTKC